MSFASCPPRVSFVFLADIACFSRQLNLGQCGSHAELRRAAPSTRLAVSGYSDGTEEDPQHLVFHGFSQIVCLPRPMRSLAHARGKQANWKTSRLRPCAPCPVVTSQPARSINLARSCNNIMQRKCDVSCRNDSLHGTSAARATHVVRGNYSLSAVACKNHVGIALKVQFDAGEIRLHSPGARKCRRAVVY